MFRSLERLDKLLHSVHIKYIDRGHNDKMNSKNLFHKVLVEKDTSVLLNQIQLLCYESRTFRYCNHIPYNTIHDFLKYGPMPHVEMILLLLTSSVRPYLP